MSTVVSSLLRVKTEDDKYVIVLPIITTEECFYDVENRISIGMVVDEIKEKLHKSNYDATADVTEVHSITGYSEGETTSTGMICIQLPEGLNNSFQALEIYGYTGTDPWRITASTRCDEEMFVNPSFTVEGNCPISTVRFGIIEGKIALILGDESTTWENSIVLARNILTTSQADWSEGYKTMLLQSTLIVKDLMTAEDKTIYKPTVKRKVVIGDHSLSTIDIMKDYNSKKDLVDVFASGIKMIEGIDFNIADKSITLTKTPTDDSIVYEVTVTKNIR